MSIMINNQIETAMSAFSSVENIDCFKCSYEMNSSFEALCLIEEAAHFNCTFEFAI